MAVSPSHDNFAKAYKYTFIWFTKKKKIIRKKLINQTNENDTYD